MLGGIPHGSILGPLLFLIFISDLEDDIVSMILKFADDTKIFRKMTNSAEGLQLQQDLKRLCDWADKWQMAFNITKCKTMHIGNGSIEYDYSMKGRQFDVVIFFHLLKQSTKRNCTRRTAIAEATTYNSPYLHTIA